MGTNRDIPAIDILTRFSREWGGIGRPSAKASIDGLQQYRSRMSDVTTRTQAGVTSVQCYVDDVGKEISSLSGQVKTSLVENVHIMAGLIDKFVPTKRLDELTYGSFYTSSRMNDNEMTARQAEEIAKTIAQQQELGLFLEEMKHTCEKVRSQDGLDTEDIERLKDHLKDYGDTLETEKERRDREEKQKKERERRERKEKERKKEEERRRNPENWKPLVLKDTSGEERFANSDVLCVVYAMQGSFDQSSLQCDNKEGLTSDWLYTPYEQQASCPTLVRCNGYKSLDLEVPMEVYVPYSISNDKCEPEVKISIDNGTWKYPGVLNSRKIEAFPEGVNYIGTTVPNFQSFRIIVVAVAKKKDIVVDKNGISFQEDCVHFLIPPEFGKDKIKFGSWTDTGQGKNVKNLLGAQVRIEVDCMEPTTKDINVKISPEQLSSHCKERKAVGAAVNQYFISSKDLSNFRLDTFLQHLQTERVITTKELNENKNQKTKDKKIKHLLELLLDKPSAAEKVLMCLDKSGNDGVADEIRELVKEIRGTRVVEEQWRSVMVYRADGGNWEVLDPKLASKLHKTLECKLSAGKRHFDLVSLTVSGDSSETDIKGIADEFGKGMFVTTVTLVCRQKEDDYQAETFIHVLPTEQASKEISRLKEQGYTRGPMELADFTVVDGDIVDLYMSGNIGLQHNGRRILQGEVVKFPFKTQKDICKVNCSIYVVDKTCPEQMDDECYRGLLHYRVKARKPLEERTDSVEVVWVKTTKRYLSHLSVNGDIQALTKFIGSKTTNRQEMHSIFTQMDTPNEVKEIETRVEKQCKDDTDSVRFATTLYIWANQNQDEKQKKLEKMLHAVRQYPWCKEARQLVALYMDTGVFSEVSLLSMSKMLGPEWKDLAIALKLPEAQVDYIKNMQLSEQDAKGKMLDKYRLSDYAIRLGDRLPGEFLQTLQQCKCSAELLAYVKMKVK
ncbi:uncharacterized protein LOC110447626 [Mizuhopecten yessoensis]|uniref:uncharacterized protein LOC110447626 n=1 Tax=Mizuhopecten yessoensis TaxID=6573 RepID=UPI000B457740|nr:uncharacterized protein LOC110447626 [Mizuhopecten yessoensis]